MKLGIFDFEIVIRGKYFFPELILDNKILYTYGGFPTKQEAFDIGTRKLEALFQGFLNDLKPKYQTKPKPVDAMQWFPEWLPEQHGIHKSLDRYFYCSQPIMPGDWIVDGKVVTDEEFEQDYEVIT